MAENLNSTPNSGNTVLSEGEFIGKKFIDTWKDEVVTIVETTGEPNYFKFENDSYSVYYWLGDRFAPFV